MKSRYVFDSITCMCPVEFIKRDFEIVIKPCPDFAGTGFLYQVITRNVGQGRSTAKPDFNMHEWWRILHEKGWSICNYHKFVCKQNQRKLRCSNIYANIIFVNSMQICQLNNLVLIYSLIR